MRDETAIAPWTGRAWRHVAGSVRLRPRPPPATLAIVPAPARRRGTHRIVPMPGSATDPDKDAALILDGATGKVLYARNETAERHPASLTKMMTLYLLFEALKAGKVTMQTPMPVSAHAAQQKPTKLILRPGETITVDTAIRAIVMRSANDVAVVIAEALGGTEVHFAEMMTEKARAARHARNQLPQRSGLPDPLQITTASGSGRAGAPSGLRFPAIFPLFRDCRASPTKASDYPTHDNLIGRYRRRRRHQDRLHRRLRLQSGLFGGARRRASHRRRDGRAHRRAPRPGNGAAARHRIRPDRRQSDLGGARPVPWAAVARCRPAARRWRASACRPSRADPASQFAALSAMPPPPMPDTDDEDAAEARRAPDENFSSHPCPGAATGVGAAPPKPAPVTAMPPAVAQAARDADSRHASECPTRRSQRPHPSPASHGPDARAQTIDHPQAGNRGGVAEDAAGLAHGYGEGDEDRPA